LFLLLFFCWFFGLRKIFECYRVFFSKVLNGVWFCVLPQNSFFFYKPLSEFSTSELRAKPCFVHLCEEVDILHSTAYGIFSILCIQWVSNMDEEVGYFDFISSSFSFDEAILFKTGSVSTVCTTCTIYYILLKRVF